MWEWERNRTISEYILKKKEGEVTGQGIYHPLSIIDSHWKVKKAFFSLFSGKDMLSEMLMWPLRGEVKNHWWCWLPFHWSGNENFYRGASCRLMKNPWRVLFVFFFIFYVFNVLRTTRDQWPTKKSLPTYSDKKKNNEKKSGRWKNSMKNIFWLKHIGPE